MSPDWSTVEGIIIWMGHVLGMLELCAVSTRKCKHCEGRAMQSRPLIRHENDRNSAIKSHSVRLCPQLPVIMHVDKTVSTTTFPSYATRLQYWRRKNKRTDNIFTSYRGTSWYRGQHYTLFHTEHGWHWGREGRGAEDRRGHLQRTSRRTGSTSCCAKPSSNGYNPWVGVVLL